MKQVVLLQKLLMVTCIVNFAKRVTPLENYFLLYHSIFLFEENMFRFQDIHIFVFSMNTLQNLRRHYRYECILKVTLSIASLES